MLENFCRDPKSVKSIFFFNSTRYPQFRDTEWWSLISGRSGDLDRVLAGGYAVVQDERRTERVRQLEFVFGSSKSSKIVDTQGKWVIACDQTVKFTHKQIIQRDRATKGLTTHRLSPVQ
jgi:hypothetical protein